MATPLNDERLAEMRSRLSQTEPLYYCQLTGSEVHSLLDEVERLRALVRDLNAALVAKQQEGDRLAGDYVAIRAENQSLRDHHYDLRTEVARLRAANWREHTIVSLDTCPECGRLPPDHAPDCALDAALRNAHD